MSVYCIPLILYTKQSINDLTKKTFSSLIAITEELLFTVHGHTQCTSKHLHILGVTVLKKILISVQSSSSNKPIEHS